MTLPRDDRRFIQAAREKLLCDKYRKHAHIASQAHPKLLHVLLELPNA